MTKKEHLAALRMLAAAGIIQVKELYVAKRAHEKYAAEKKEGGYGTIVDVDLKDAKAADEPAGLAVGFLGGHYRGYKPVRVLVVSAIVEEQEVQWPKDSEMGWDD